VPQVEVTFDIDANGILHVGAKDRATGKEQSMRVTAPLKMRDEEIKQKMADADRFAEQDRKVFELATARNEAESMAYLAKKTVEELKEKMSKEQFDMIDAARKKVEDAVTGEDVARMRAETDALKKALEEVGGSMYQQQGGEAPPGGPGGEQPPPGAGGKGYERVKKKKKGGDNVVEGEYEKVDK
jgi:molecular chaperone DnaK